ncbi:MAG: PAS domain S-box protein [Abitibacteriaceae bacterium]|nr:PAS domain S-box protein [Abditibacteriaceae bacterium]
MEVPLRILHLEDNPDDAKLIAWTLLEAGIDCHIQLAESRDEFVAALEGCPFDLILSDYRLPAFTGLEAMALAHEKCPDVPYIFITGAMGEDLAIESLKSGATDYVLKQKLARLAPAVQRAIKETEERRKRQHAEEVSRLSETRFRTLFEQFPYSLQIMAPDGHTLRVNQAWEQLWNVKLEDIAGYNMLQDQQLKDKGVMPYILKAFAGEPSPIPAIRYEPDETLDNTGGRPRWVAAFICPVKDESGAVREVVLIHQDITEQRLVEATLQQTEMRLHSLAESNLMGIIFGDVHGGISYANDAFLQMIGYTREDFAAGLVRWTDVTPREYFYLDERAIAEAKEKGSCTPYEKEYICKDGTHIPVLVGFVLLGPEREETVAFILDLKEQKRTEAALREETENLETINRVGQTLAAELDLQKLAQAIMDAAVELSDAEFGVFYNMNSTDRTYTIYAISGDPPEGFGHIPSAHNTSFVGPTLRGEGIVRLDDVTTDPRYGKEIPFNKMPLGDFPVRSYLAVPIVSRSGEVLGGLFFAHSQAGVFTARTQQIIEGLAAQSAIAMDNARLFEAIKREQLQTQASEQNYRFLAESIPQIVWTARPDGYLDYFNQRWFDYTGLSGKESQDAIWEQVLHPDDVQRGAETWQPSLATGQPYQIEFRLKRASDGAYRWHLGRAEPLRDENGQIVKWFGTATDIDDRKRTEESLRFLAEATTLLTSSLDYELTLNQVAQLAVPHIADWCAVDIWENGKLRRIATAHKDPEKIAMAQDLERRYPARTDLPYGSYHVARTGQSEIMSDIPEELLKASARDEAHLELLLSIGLKSYMCVPLLTRGRVLGIITFIATESKRSYQQEDLVLAEELARSAAQAGDNALLYHTAQQARQVAEDASRAKDEFLATLSHELRTPLNAILGWVSLLRSGKLDAETTSQALETIERNTRVQTQLVEDILDVSRIITGKLHLESRPVTLVPLIESALTAVRPAAEAKGVQLRAVLDFSVGPVSGDPTRLQQVIWNLLSNAIKFTPRNGRVEIHLERVDSHLEIVVSDTGQGINPEFLPHVFDRFRQADSSSTRAHGGLGLGLSIVKHLVELHGGTVSVRSAGAGTGSQFTVCLPLLAVHPAEVTLNGQVEPDRPEVVASAPFDCPPVLKGLRVLVVDDENDARQLITQVLQQCSAEVIAVASVAAALEALQRDKPDVLVSDIGMPNEDGYSLIRKIRALPAESGGRIPAAALTAYARTEDRTRVLAAGYQMHIPKPVESNELVVVVASLSGRSGAEVLGS